MLQGFGLSDAGGVVKDDFEGIAVAEDRIYLVTSTGRLYEFREGADGDHVPFVVYPTAAGRDFEIEGLAYEPRTRELLLVSKRPRGSGADGRLPIYRWSIDTRRLIEGGDILIPVKAIAARIPGKAFAPSGIERHPVSGHYFLVAAREHAIAEITPDGALVGVKELSSKRHGQAEGITLGPNQSLIISDEGDGKKAWLTVYPLLPR